MPSYSSFLASLSAINTYNLDNYHFTYHSKSGFNLFKKHVTPFRAINRIIDPVIRAWNTVMGHSYAFENNVAKLLGEMKKDCVNITDVKSCIASCRRLRAITERVFEKKYKDPTELTDLITETAFKLLSKKAKQESISVLECACKYGVFKEAHILISQDPEMVTISQDSKNKLLGYFLDKHDHVMVDRVIQAGADIRTQVLKLRPTIHQIETKKLLKGNLNHDFVLINKNGQIDLKEPKVGLDISKDVINPIAEGFSHYRGSTFILSHTVDKIAAYVEQNHFQINDTKECVVSLKKLITKLQVHNDDLAQLVNIAVYTLLSSKAQSEEISALELALRLDLFDEVEYLVDQGSDTTIISNESKTKLFGFYLNCDHELCRDLLVLGADATPHARELRPFLHYLMKRRDQEAACMVLDAGAARGTTNPDKSDSAFLVAASYGLVRVVDKLITMGEPLNQRGKHEDTALHLAARHYQYEMVDWLAKRVDVVATDNSDQTAFSYLVGKSYFSAKPKLEQAFLLNDLKECRALLMSQNATDARRMIAELRANYPLSCVDHLLYSVNEAHFKNQALIALPAEVAPQSEVAELLILFDQMNLTNAYGAHYVNPQEYFPDTETSDPRKLRGHLAKLVNNVTNRVAFIGTPRPGPSLDVFYKAMERAITHTIQSIKDMPDSDEKIKIRNRVLVQFMRASTYCGGKQYATACQQYVAVIRGLIPTFKDEILEILGNFREVLFQSLVPTGGQSVHDFNKMMFHLGVELGIPGAEMMDNFEDHYGVHILDYDKIKRDFLKLYSSKNIIFECVKQAIEQSNDLRSKSLDWFKANVPASWKKSYFDQIHQHVDTLETIEEQIAYLETLDITVEEEQSVKEAIDEASNDDAAIAYTYLGLEVVEDMSSAQMKIKPSAIAYMLQSMQVLDPVYKWDYSLLKMGGFVISGAWKGFKAILRSFF